MYQSLALLQNDFRMCVYNQQGDFFTPITDSFTEPFFTNWKIVTELSSPDASRVLFRQETNLRLDFQSYSYVAQPITTQGRIQGTYAITNVVTCVDGVEIDPANAPAWTDYTATGTAATFQQGGNFHPLSGSIATEILPSRFGIFDAIYRINTPFYKMTWPSGALLRTVHTLTSDKAIETVIEGGGTLPFGNNGRDPNLGMKGFRWGNLIIDVPFAISVNIGNGADVDWKSYTPSVTASATEPERRVSALYSHGERFFTAVHDLREGGGSDGVIVRVFDSDEAEIYATLPRYTEPSLFTVGENDTLFLSAQNRDTRSWDLFRSDGQDGDFELVSTGILPSSFVHVMAIGSRDDFIFVGGTDLTQRDPAAGCFYCFAVSADGGATFSEPQNAFREHFNGTFTKYYTRFCLWQAGDREGGDVYASDGVAFMATGQGQGVWDTLVRNRLDNTIFSQSAIIPLLPQDFGAGPFRQISATVYWDRTHLFTTPDGIVLECATKRPTGDVGFTMIDALQNDMKWQDVEIIGNAAASLYKSCAVIQASKVGSSHIVLTNGVDFHRHSNGYGEAGSWQEGLG